MSQWLWQCLLKMNLFVMFEFSWMLFAGKLLLGRLLPERQSAEFEKRLRKIVIDFYIMDGSRTHSKIV
ncbi:hypothetical protein COP2_027003 [Malus domestica]